MTPWRTKFCSDKCKRSLLNKLLREKSRSLCRHCGSSFAGRADYCGPSCRTAARSARWASLRARGCPKCHGDCLLRCKHDQRERDREYRRAYNLRTRKDPLILCRVCGASVIRSKTGRRALTCSADCRREFLRTAQRKMRSESGRRRHVSHIRRAMQVGAEHEKVKRIVVFERANWRCQICDRDTPRSLLRDYKSLSAPTLDHIIPISKGGSHTYKNCQCLCRSCNSHKGADLPQSSAAWHFGVICGKKHIPKFLDAVKEFEETGDFKTIEI